MKAFLPLIVFAALATPAGAQSREILGYAGVLGEWELTATVTEVASSRGKAFTGVLTMKHVGMCTQGGPEEKTGEIRLQLLAWSRLNATLLIEGVECAYSGSGADPYTGTMSCPDRGPLPLTLWAK